MSRSSEARTGLFVVAALAILALGSGWILGSKPFSGARVPYDIVMKRSGGVRGGDSVRLAGVEVGRVDEVLLEVDEAWPVTFQVELDPGVTLSEGSSARFASDGLLGSSFLEIIAGPRSAERLPPGGRIQGQEGGDFSEMLSGMDGIAEKAETLLDDAAVLVKTASERLGPTLDRLDRLLSDENLEAASGSLQSMKKILDAAESRLPQLLARLEGLVAKADVSVEELPGLLEGIEGLMADLTTALGEDGQRLSGALDAAESAFVSVEGAFSVLQEQEGDLEATLRNLREASAHLKAFAQSIRTQPSRVLRTPKSPDRKPGEGVKP